MDSPNSTARERVLMVAEQLFVDRGYAAVSMNDLASALGMQKASLYYHAAGGKEALFVEVMERILQRYQAGLERTIGEAGSSFQAQLQAAAAWLLDMPSLHYERMMQSDMPKLSPENADRLRRSTNLALIRPLEAVFKPQMQQRGVDPSKVIYLAGAFLSVIEGVHNLPEGYGTTSKRDMADFLITTLFMPFGT